jgi:hypothetical protein
MLYLPPAHHCATTTQGDPRLLLRGVAILRQRVLP